MIQNATAQDCSMKFSAAHGGLSSELLGADLGSLVQAVPGPRTLNCSTCCKTPPSNFRTNSVNKGTLLYVLGLASHQDVLSLEVSVDDVLLLRQILHFTCTTCI